MTYLVLAEMQLAISAAYVRLFIRSISMSFSFLMSIFLKPDLSMCLVFLSCLLPILGSRTLPLKRLLTQESTPLCFLQDLLTRLNSSDWYLLILFVFFLIILVLFKGCTAIILYLIPPC